ncbi:hypothetical protein RFI_19250 [Reticulomyxa filosa]|uniref:Uncharacterized protein n=1 Tax=Reticulomyxa filosa TaxID=46433 RepID=X6MWM5_RETFI|nr:hypothetical protein RFI_19250 [Reticulomyxa filosa]|eukprot:ETO18046.1 hypothetical protein RFI_19250 [Reticulomyxa filosa]
MKKTRFVFLTELITFKYKERVLDKELEKVCVQSFFCTPLLITNYIRKDISYNKMNSNLKGLFFLLNTDQVEQVLLKFNTHMIARQKKRSNMLTQRTKESSIPAFHHFQMTQRKAYFWLHMAHQKEYLQPCLGVCLVYVCYVLGGGGYAYVNERNIVMLLDDQFEVLNTIELEEKISNISGYDNELLVVNLYRVFGHEIRLECVVREREVRGGRYFNKGNGVVLAKSNEIIVKDLIDKYHEDLNGTVKDNRIGMGTYTHSKIEMIESKRHHPFVSPYDSYDDCVDNSDNNNNDTLEKNISIILFRFIETLKKTRYVGFCILLNVIRNIFSFNSCLQWTTGWTVVVDDAGQAGERRCALSVELGVVKLQQVGDDRVCAN